MIDVIDLLVYADGDKDPDFGELRASFDPYEWTTGIDGLIYTDRGWLRSFRLGLRRLGFSWEACMDVEYSEQGMQGGNFVSMDVGAPFIREYLQKSQIPVDAER